MTMTPSPTPQSLPDLGALTATPAQPVRVLMVCLGNICRSPSAQGVLEQRLQQAGLQRCVHVDSAGTGDYHIGKPPDERAQQHAARRGIDLSRQRARQLGPRDFDDFDLVLVMDEANERDASALCPPGQCHKLRRLTDYCTRHNASAVPDPYYGGAAGFEAALDLIEDACDGLLAALRPATAGC
jgi:protein-tyrosine phosphatase